MNESCSVNPILEVEFLQRSRYRYKCWIQTSNTILKYNPQGDNLYIEYNWKHNKQYDFKGYKSFFEYNWKQI